MDAENEAWIEAVPMRARPTRHLWLMVGDANVNPEDFRKSLWFQRRVHDYRSAARRKSYLLVWEFRGDPIERKYDCVIARRVARQDQEYGSGG